MGFNINKFVSFMEQTLGNRFMGYFCAGDALSTISILYRHTLSAEEEEIIEKVIPDPIRVEFIEVTDEDLKSEIATFGYTHLNYRYIKPMLEQ